jgi:diphthamide synthase (EF-2-diphthine--ammonia ligase)
MVEGGLRSIVTCVNPARLDRSFAGRTFDASFLDDLPPDIDPCAERGEFHTCAIAGPMFGQPIDAMAGEVVERDGYVFADVVLGDGGR